MTTTFRAGLAMAAILIAAAAFAGPATAKAAKNLKCKRCVSAEELAADAKPAGVGYNSSTATFPLVQDAAPRAILSLKMKTPGRGYIVYAVDFLVTHAGKNPVVECLLANNNNKGLPVGMPVNMVPVDEGHTAVSFQRVLKMNKRAKVKVTLECGATGEPGSIVQPNLIGTFVPANY